MISEQKKISRPKKKKRNEEAPDPYQMDGPTVFRISPFARSRKKPRRTEPVNPNGLGMCFDVGRSPGRTLVNRAGPQDTPAATETKKASTDNGCRSEQQLSRGSLDAVRDEASARTRLSSATAVNTHGSSSSEASSDSDNDDDSSDASIGNDGSDDDSENSSEV